MNVLISDSTIKSLTALQDTLLSLSDVTADAVYAVLGRTAWHGRQNIIDVEEKYFTFGEEHSFTNSKGVRRHPTTRYYSEYGWASPNAVDKLGRPRRIVNYSFETSEALRSKTKFKRSVKKAYVSSLMMNLFEKTAHWKKDSPWIDESFRYHKGDVRQGYNLYSKEFRGVESVVPLAISRTERDLQGKINAISK